MEAYLSIQEIALKKINTNDEPTYIIYPSLLDMYGKTKEDLDALITLLGANNLFMFGNTGTYIGIDHRTNMHFTCDDGRESIAWLMNLIQVLSHYYLATKNNIKIHIVKDDILSAGLMELDSGERIDNKKADEFIRLYTDTLVKFAKTCRSSWIIDTRIKPIEDSKYKVTKAYDRFIISKKKTAK